MGEMLAGWKTACPFSNAIPSVVMAERHFFSRCFRSELSMSRPHHTDEMDSMADSCRTNFDV
jgi:hypothetical protein